VSDLSTTIDCATDPIGALKRMFVDMTMGPRLARRQSPARRPVFLKTHGSYHAEARFPRRAFWRRRQSPPETGHAHQSTDAAA
jgi:hypothetical protein